MISSNYQKLNIVLGWLVFLTALITYTVTLESTVSYWDCGEYIATSVKLEVGHPPGAPLFQMLGAFFALFTSDVTEIAKTVNFMSGLSSGFTILFLFWTITNLTKKLALKSGDFSESKAITVLGSGLVGALAYAFSDSFWFSAVESEVYAMSSFLMALLFWLALRWEKEMHTVRGNKWLLLISYVVGLSFGVHILSLLVIPSIVFVYLYKKNRINTISKFALANVVAISVLLLVFKFLFPFTLQFFSFSELFFVNDMGFPFNSGSMIAGLVLVLFFYVSLTYTVRKKMLLTNTLLLSVLFVMIGFSCWLVLPIRANANTTLNENNPSSARELLAYYNREQYGDANVFYDSYYSESYQREQKKDSSGNSIYKDGKPKYEKNYKTEHYDIVNEYQNSIPVYTNKHKGFIPRMTNPSLIDNYKKIARIDSKSKEKPTFFQNMFFMINYQFGYMYGRYLMWNFVGRQNDVQGMYDLENGNWLSGINFLDKARLGPQSNLPDVVKNNKGRNTYYFLPLILGLLGLVYQLKRDQNNFYILFLFFVFTGLAIVFYTNPKPFEPRERDYAVVGSFYVFAIWIGFGVYALFDYLKRFISPKIVSIAIVLITFFTVPTLMAIENWDDHDRSNRYTTRLNSILFLDSCEENSILFTIADNDTMPLWYLQEVEGYRTDVKIINTSYFATDWYIDQMKRKTYNAPPIPSQLNHNQYKYGSLDVVYHYPQTTSRWDLKDFMTWIASDDERTYFETESGHKEKFYPTNKLRLHVDKEAVLKSGLVSLNDEKDIVPYIDFEIDEQLITKNRILMLDILANNNWKQILCFTGGANADEEYLWLKSYLKLEGLVYKLVPIKTVNTGGILNLGSVDTECNYRFWTHVDWGNSGDGNIYIDPQTSRSYISVRNNMLRLASKIIDEGAFEKAQNILDISVENMPIKEFGYYELSLRYPELYYAIDEVEKARSISEILTVVFQQKLKYYSQFDESYLELIFDEIEQNLGMYGSLVKTIHKFDRDEEYFEGVESDFVKHVRLFQNLLE